MANPEKIPVLEIFGPTIQGEGPLIGRRTYFLRTAGCDYKCTRCDSLFSVLPELYKPLVKIMSPADIYQELWKLSRTDLGKSHVVITGGNPALCDLYTIVSKLKRNGWDISVETQGSVWAGWLSAVDTLVVSPKGPGMGCSPEVTMEHVTAFMEKRASFAASEQQVILKIPVFGAGDFQLAEALHQQYPYIPMYLSVGNTSPPGTEVFGITLDEQRRQILNDLERFHDILNEKYPSLSDVFLLPQLHVLIWGNKQGV